FLDRAAEVSAELVQREIGNSRAVEGGAGIERVIPQRVKDTSVEVVSACLRYDLDLWSASGSAFGRVDGAAHPELGERVERDVQASLGLLRLFLDTVVVDAIEGVVRVVNGVPVEADVALGAVAEVDGARRQEHKARPIPAADRKFLDLRCFDFSAHLGR